MRFSIYSSNVIGREKNCLYPKKIVVTCPQELKEAVERDYTCAQYKNSYRSSDNFLASDCLCMDCDNTHSENPREWLTPKKVAEKLKDVGFAVHYSRHNMQPKNGKAARPRFHIFVPIDPVSDIKEYVGLKQAFNTVLPYFDKGAMDGARFFFGTETPQVELFEGKLNFDGFLERRFEEFAQSPGTIKEGARHTTMLRYAARVVKRYGAGEEAYALFRKKLEACDPPLPEAEIRQIWQGAAKFWAKIAGEEGYVPPDEYNRQTEWEAPIPIAGYEPPKFPVDALPKPIADYVSALAESTQTPVDMAAMSAIAVLSVCMQGKFRIMPKQDWSEPVNTFVLNVMNPSERKSAVENAMIRPLNDYEAEQNRLNAPLIEAGKMRRRNLERRQKAIEEQAVKGNASEEDILRIAEEITSFKEPRPLRLYVDDITAEKLASVLAENDGRIAILSTEGGIFDTLAGAYSKNVNIDVMLKGYSGDCIRVDRIGRNSESIMSPALTVLLMVQPSVLSGLMQNGAFRGRGLTSRFLYCVPKSSVGSRRYDTVPVPAEVYRSYDRLIRNLLEDSYPEEPETITLSPEADKLIAAFAEELEPKLKGSYEEFSDWAGKLVGNVLRIAALLCRASVYRGHEFLDEFCPLVVDKNVMQNAIRIGRYLIEHARVAHVIMGMEPDAGRCRRVLDTITENGLSRFNRRDIMRLCRSFKKAEDVQKILDQLQDYGYIMPEAVEYSGKGRPQARFYLVNPHICA